MNFKDERGSAVLELIGFGVLLQIPMLVLAFQLVAAQHDQLAADAIARDSLRSYLIADRSLEQNALGIASSYRVPVSKLKLSMQCNPQDCSAPGSIVKVSVQVGQAKASAVMQR